MITFHRFARGVPTPRPGLRLRGSALVSHGWMSQADGWRYEKLDQKAVDGDAMTYRRGEFVAWYSAHGTVWLQVGERGWDCGDIRELVKVWEGITMSKYELRLKSGTVDRIRLRFPRDVIVLRLLDFSYDGFDDMRDDIVSAIPHTYSGKPSFQSITDWISCIVSREK